jgi:hypothetical protein
MSGTTPATSVSASCSASLSGAPPLDRPCRRSSIRSREKAGSSETSFGSNALRASCNSAIRWPSGAVPLSFLRYQPLAT